MPDNAELDWFGEAPLAVGEPLLPGWMTEWVSYCQREGCDAESQVYYVEGAEYLCFIHAEDVYT